jgi:outer membrane autotransporter protein
MFLKSPKALANPAPQWGIWSAAYGSAVDTRGDPAGLGSHDLAGHTAGFATGIDDRVDPDTRLGFALAGGGTSWSLSQGLGGGRSDVFQAGLYGSRQLGAAYFTGALAYGSFWASTSRNEAVAGANELSADFNGQDFAGRVEAGYHVRSLMPFDLRPYASLQAQTFSTPAYSETAAGGSPFQLAFSAQAAMAVRGELGGWADKTFTLASGAGLRLAARLAWAHDWQANPQVNATFLELPAASFAVFGAAQPTDSMLVSNAVEWRSRTGWSFLAKFDGEFAGASQKYSGTARLGYAW